MAQYIKQAPLAARFGSGFGQGLGEQLPKELERARLAHGLAQFEKDAPSLSPMQQIARLSAIPGITPQMISSMGELARQGGYGRAMQNLAGEMPMGASDIPQHISARGTDIPREIQPEISYKKASEPSREYRPTSHMPHEINLRLQGLSQGRNPFSPISQPRPPFSIGDRASQISNLISKGFTPDQAAQLQAQDEAARREMPGIEAQRQAGIASGEKAAMDELSRQMSMRLQKAGDASYRDIVGDMQADMQDRMIRELKENPHADIRELASSISKDALNFARSKQHLKELALTTGLEGFAKPEIQDKLSHAAEIYRKMGRSQEYFDFLRTKPSSDTIGMGMSPQGAALIAYPPSSEVAKAIDTYKAPKGRFHQYAGTHIASDLERAEAAKNFADDVIQKISDDDSFLAIAKDIRKKDREFDERAFFNRLRERRDEIHDPRLQEELLMGEKNWLPSWGDIMIFFGGKK